MKAVTLQEAVQALQGTCDVSVAYGNVTGVSIDSREVKSGDLFVAIKGQQHDGHDHVRQALSAGAVAAVVRDDFELPPQPADENVSTADVPLVRVDNTVAAMGRFAHYYRRTLIDGSASVIAVTGSNGKTTTKEMIAHVLRGRMAGKGSKKSFNNEIGVPLTLLSVEPEESFVVCEVGTNAPGEIAALSRLVEPELAVLTGVSEAHLKGLGSLEGIVTEKLSLLHHVRPSGCAIVNADHHLVREALRRDWQLERLKIVTFGESQEADLRVSQLAVVPMETKDKNARPRMGLEFVLNDRFRYRLGVLGKHNVINALGAIGVARRLGMTDEEIADRLATFELPPMRLQQERIGELTVINDAYNANPASMAAALDVLTTSPVAGRRVFVMGEMRELGKESDRLHEELADKAGKSGIDVVIAIGKQSKRIAKAVKEASSAEVETHAHVSVQAAKRRFISYLEPDDTILIKGSRALELERLLPLIRKWAER
jgi:UDP-N-acetylmuramoyl-tripeptide--D-alanyl-D-alanine ligase